MRLCPPTPRFHPGHFRKTPSPSPGALLPHDCGSGSARLSATLFPAPESFPAFSKSAVWLTGLHSGQKKSPRGTRGLSERTAQPETENKTGEQHNLFQLSASNLILI